MAEIKQEVFEDDEASPKLSVTANSPEPAKQEPETEKQQRPEIEKSSHLKTEISQKSTIMAALFSEFPKKDAKNFTEGSVISDCPTEFDSFETSKELKLNRLPYYVQQSDKHELTKIINDPTNEILRYLEAQNNVVAKTGEDRPKAVPKRKLQGGAKRKTTTGAFADFYSSRPTNYNYNNSGNNSPSSKRSKQWRMG